MTIKILKISKRTHRPPVVFVDEENKISRITSYEKHGRLEDMK